MKRLTAPAPSKLKPKWFADPTLLQKMRKQIGISQHGLAKKAGLKRSLIANIEADRRTFSEEVRPLIWKALLAIDNSKIKTGKVELNTKAVFNAADAMGRTGLWKAAKSPEEIYAVLLEALRLSENEGKTGLSLDEQVDLWEAAKTPEQAVATLHRMSEGVKNAVLANMKEQLAATEAQNTLLRSQQSTGPENKNEVLSRYIAAVESENKALREQNKTLREWIDGQHGTTYDNAFKEYSEAFRASQPSAFDSYARLLGLPDIKSDTPKAAIAQRVEERKGFVAKLESLGLDDPIIGKIVESFRSEIAALEEHRATTEEGLDTVLSLLPEATLEKLNADLDAHYAQIEERLVHDRIGDDPELRAQFKAFRAAQLKKENQGGTD